MSLAGSCAEYEYQNELREIEMGTGKKSQEGPLDQQGKGGLRTVPLPTLAEGRPRWLPVLSDAEEIYGARQRF